MNIKNMKKFFAFGLVSCAVSASLTSCENGDATFPDYEGGTSVYFPYQSPVRTIILGDDEYDTTLDKNHQCLIKATFGGSYSGSNGSAQVAVDPTLVEGLTFSDGRPVKVMPTEYYSLSTTNLEFKGSFNGTTTVQLTDAFFNDPDASKATYVIPLVMTSQKGFGKILTGELKEGGKEVRTDKSQWEVLPMDYVLYCVKYQNKYAGTYLTHGNTSIDNIEKAGTATINCTSMTTCEYPISYTEKNYKQYKRDKDGNKTTEVETVSKTFTTTLKLTFSADDKCVITSANAATTATGNGSWTDNGAKASWNNKDRDLMELEYAVDFNATDELGNPIKTSVHEKLVWQRSGVTTEEFIK